LGAIFVAAGKRRKWMAEYIEREAAIFNIRKMASMIGFENPAVAIDCAVKCLERVPAADVAPVVHGWWIHDINNLYGCSECLGRETMPHKKLKPYCPNCGAKMKDGE
jgi:hypothetical protein